MKGIALLTVLDDYSVEHGYDFNKIIDSGHVIGINPNHVVSIETYDILETGDYLCAIRTSDGTMFYSMGTVSEIGLRLGFAPEEGDRE